jgi:hypothetical protein
MRQPVNVAHALASIVLVFGGIVPYVTQYRQLSIASTPVSRESGRRGSATGTAPASGFSHFVCFILLIANITRVFYWQVTDDIRAN